MSGGYKNFKGTAGSNGLHKQSPERRKEIAKKGGLHKKSIHKRMLDLLGDGRNQRYDECIELEKHDIGEGKFRYLPTGRKVSVLIPTPTEELLARKALSFALKDPKMLQYIMNRVDGSPTKTTINVEGKMDTVSMSNHQQANLLFDNDPEFSEYFVREYIRRNLSDIQKTYSGNELFVRDEEENTFKLAYNPLELPESNVDQGNYEKEDDLEAFGKDYEGDNDTITT